jgi:hypothetical protein
VCRCIRSQPCWRGIEVRLATCIEGQDFGDSARSRELIPGCVNPKACGAESGKGAAVARIESNAREEPSRRAVPAGGDLWSDEDRRTGVGARSALRPLTRRNCLSATNEVSEASYATRPLAENRSAVGAVRRPRNHEPLAGTAWRDAKAPTASTGTARRGAKARKSPTVTVCRGARALRKHNRSQTTTKNQTRTTLVAHLPISRQRAEHPTA